MAVLKAIPVAREFGLETDEAKEAIVTIRQATWGENAQRETIFAKQSMEWNDDDRGTVRQTFNWTQSQLIQKEIYLTLANVVGLKIQQVDKHGEPKGDPEELFPFVTANGKSRLALSEDEFYKRLDNVPDEMVKEIHQCVRKVNIQWQSTEKN